MLAGMISPADFRCPPLLLLAVGLAVGDLLLWDVSPGLGAALAVVVLAILPLVGRRDLHLGSHLVVTGGLVAALAVGLALTGASLGLVLAPVILGLWAASLGQGPGLRFLVLLQDGVVGLASGGGNALRLLVGLRGVRGGAGWVLPIALTGVFAALLGFANPVIAQVWARLQDLLDGVSIPDAGRLGLWLILGIIMGSSLLRRHLREAADDQPATRREGSVTAPLRFLLLANLLFAAQHLLDLRYLIGAAALPEGLTYAEYAHRGSYPLMATVLLAGVVVLAWFRPGSPAENDGRARGLVLAWLVQNALLVAAAAWRLHLYVDAYGLSRWRVAAAVWMAVVAIGLGLMAWRLVQRRSNAWLASASAVVTAGALVVITWVPVDAVIAWHNVQHCREAGGDGVPADLDYLADLDASAAPAIAWLALHSHDQAVAAQAKEVAQVQQALLTARRSDWRAWTALEGR